MNVILNKKWLFVEIESSYSVFRFILEFLCFKMSICISK